MIANSPLYNYYSTKDTLIITYICADKPIGTPYRKETNNRQTTTPKKKGKHE